MLHLRRHECLGHDHCKPTAFEISKLIAGATTYPSSLQPWPSSKSRMLIASHARSPHYLPVCLLKRGSASRSLRPGCHFVKQQTTITTPRNQNKQQGHLKLLKFLQLVLDNTNHLQTIQSTSITQCDSISTASSKRTRYFKMQLFKAMNFMLLTTTGIATQIMPGYSDDTEVESIGVTMLLFPLSDPIAESHHWLT